MSPVSDVESRPFCLMMQVKFLNTNFSEIVHFKYRNVTKEFLVAHNALITSKDSKKDFWNIAMPGSLFFDAWN